MCNGLRWCDLLPLLPVVARLLNRGETGDDKPHEDEEAADARNGTVDSPRITSAVRLKPHKHQS